MYVHSVCVCVTYMLAHRELCMYVCMYVCMYACIHTYAHTYMHTYVRTYVHTYNPGLVSQLYLLLARQRDAQV